MTRTVVGERIRIRRKELRLTQSQLAEMTGYSDKTAISRIESGENDLTQSKIVMFADALNTTPSYLMGWVEEPTPKKAHTPKGKMAMESKNELLTAYESADDKTQRAVRILLGLE